MKKLILLLITPLLISCSDKVLFTENVKKDLINNGVNLEKIQYYNETRFTLKRDVSNSKVQITSGKIQQLNGKKINIITFVTLTPGILKSISEDPERVEIAFEDGQGKNISFSLDNKDNIFKLDESRNEIPYAAEMYQLESPYKVRLMISKSSLNSIKYDKTRAKGLKIK